MPTKELSMLMLPPVTQQHHVVTIKRKQRQKRSRAARRRTVIRERVLVVPASVLHDAICVAWEEDLSAVHCEINMRPWHGTFARVHRVKQRGRARFFPS